MGKHILIVDDDKEILESTCSILEKRGYRVSCAENGKAALDILSEHSPDLILTDVLMPQMDGFSLFKEIRRAYETSPIPVIVISGRGQMKDSFGAVGVDRFITKPFTPQELLDAIEGALAGAKTVDRPVFVRSVSKVLLVGRSDYHVQLHQMAALAQEQGFKTRLSTSVSQAVASVIEEAPDIVFTDVQLDKPVSEFMEVLRHVHGFSSKPVIGFSYYQTGQLDDPLSRRQVLKIEEDAAAFLKAGGTSYMGRWVDQAFIDLCKNHFKAQERV